MARYQIILAYDGTDFQGYQRQAKGRTVQGVLETVLSRLGWSDRATLFSGRTDSGVHAMGQVAAFDLEYKTTAFSAQIYDGSPTTLFSELDATRE